VDYLVELGRQSENMNTAVGARKGLIDDVFAGTANAKFNLGADSDIASGKLRGFHDFQPRTYNNLVGDFHVPPQFADRVALHLAKNFLSDEANPGVGSGDQKALGTTKVPLILGIWGAKGCGKTFNLELSCKLMGVTPVVMSAGELEAEWAGEPGRLVRRRYRKAAEIIKNSGTPSCLIVHDLDAGAGRFKKTQATVNTQMVMGTLMNLCDEPNRVSDESDDEIHEWREDDIIRRVPIIVTGNDLSVLYAPLLRDGRMEKFYWSPTFEDIVDMVHAMFKEENVDRATVEALVREYESQPLDFFGAIRSRMYDDAVREWAGGFRSTTPDPETGQTLYTPALGQALMDGRGRERPDDEEDPGKYIYWRPDFINHGEGESGVDMSVEAIFAHAADLQREQQLVNDKQLSLEYMRYQKTWDEVMEEGGKEAEAERMRRRKSVDERLAEMDDDMRAANDAAMDAAREALRASQEAQRLEREAYLRANPPPPEPLEPDPEPEDLEPPFDRGWRVAESVSECFHLFKTDGVPVVDVRGARDHDREAVVGSVNVPAVLVTGRPLHWEREPFDGFEEAFAKAFPDVDAEIVVVGSSDATGSPDGAAVALARLAASGRTYRNAIEVPGGYDAWVKRYTPAGKKRTGNAKYTNVVGAPGTICAFSEIITQEDGVFDDPSLMRK
jgi:rhodanese-related sulfurtransferase